MNGMIGLLLAVSLFGSDPVVELVRNTPTPYSDADAVVILDKKEIALKQDEHAIEEEEFVLKILKKEGKDRYGNKSYIYDSNFEAMKITEARVIKPTGEVVKVPEEGINEVTPWGLARTAAYDYGKQVTVSFVGLEVGDAIHVKREVKKRCPLGFGGYEIFGSLNPVVTKVVKVDIPRGAKLKWKATGEEIELKIVENEESTSYIWEGESLPRVVDEPDMPPLWSVVPRLLYTTNSSWEEVGEKFAQIFYRPLKVEDLKESVWPILRGAQGRDEIIQRLFLYATNETRSIDQAVGVGRYEPREPRLLLESGYGNRADKVGFLVSGLNSFGVEAYPVLINSHGVEIVKEVPLIHQFGSLIVAVPSEPKWLWLSPFASHWRYGVLPAAYEDRDCLIVSQGGVSFKRTPPAEPTNHLSKKVGLLELGEDGTLSGRMELSLQGQFDSQSRSRLKDKTKRERDVYLHTSCSKLSPGTRVISSQLPDLKDLTSPAEFTIQFKSPSYASKSGNLVIFEVPKYPFYFANIGLQPTLRERKYPFVLESPVCDEYEAAIEIPRSYEAKYLPPSLSLKNPVGTLEQTFEVERGKVKYTSRLILEKRRIEPGEYQYLRDLLDSRSLPKNRVIILESS